MDKNDENFLKIDFKEECEPQIAELIVLFNSGALFNDSLNILKKACDNEQHALSIFEDIAFLMNNIDNQDGPVVDPCEVFSKEDKNEFKG